MEENQKEDLAIQKNIEEAAKKAAHTEKTDRDKEVRRTPEEVRMREEAAARCTKIIKRRKQERKARADHLVKCA